MGIIAYVMKNVKRIAKIFCVILSTVNFTHCAELNKDLIKDVIPNSGINADLIFVILSIEPQEWCIIVKARRI